MLKKIQYWQVAGVTVALCTAPVVYGQETTIQVEPERGGVQVRRQVDEGNSNRPAEAGPINGQETRRQTTQPRDQRSGTTTQATTQGQRTAASISNGEIASILIPKNQAEIEVSQWVAQRSKTPEVVNFAEKMVRDHRQVVEQLQQFAPAGQALQPDSTRTGAGAANLGDDQTGQPLRRTLDQAGDAAGRAVQNTADAARNLTDGQPQSFAEGRQERVGERAEDRQQRIAQRQQRREATTTQSATAGQGGMSQSPWVQVHHQITQRVKQATMEDLQNKEGAQLDKAYLGMQIAAHTQMASELAVLQTVAQDQLRSVLAATEQATRNHLQEAKQLMQQIEQQPQR